MCLCGTNNVSFLCVAEAGCQCPQIGLTRSGVLGIHYNQTVRLYTELRCANGRRRSLAHRIDAIQNTAEVIAQSLKEMIYEAELKPGQPLIQERIAEMFQVSRVPVRDALQLLIAMGLAVNVPRRGVIVRPALAQAPGGAVRGAEDSRGGRHSHGDPERDPGTLAAAGRPGRAAGRMSEERRRQANAKLDDDFHRALYDAVGNATVGGSHLRQLGTDQAGPFGLDRDAGARHRPGSPTRSSGTSVSWRR